MYDLMRRTSEEEVTNMDVGTKRKQNMSESSVDALPIVELRPFSRKVWRREKSYAEFYNRPPDANEEAAENQFPTDCLPNIVEVLTEITQEPNQMKVDGLKRMRTKLHPKTCNINSPLEIKPGAISSFITKDDRTKTTFIWSKKDENPKSYSCRKQALNSATVRRQQEIQLHGGPLSLPENLPFQFTYLNPIAHYKQRSMMKQMKIRQSQLKHSSAPADDRINLKSLPGRELDIVQILQRRSPKPRLSPINVSGDNEELKNDGDKGNCLTNDFRKNGRKSTIIERQIDDERNFYLRHSRKNIDIGYISLDILNHLHNHSTLNSTMTQGEILLKKGKQANAIKSVHESSDKKVLAPVIERRNSANILLVRGCGQNSLFFNRPDLIQNPDDLHVRGKNNNGRKDQSILKKAFLREYSDDNNDPKDNDNQTHSNLEGNGEKGVTETENTINQGNESESSSSPQSDEMTVSGDPNITESPYIDIVAEINKHRTTESTGTPDTTASPTILKDKLIFKDNASDINESDSGVMASVSLPKIENKKSQRSGLPTSVHPKEDEINAKIPKDSLHKSHSKHKENTGIKHRPKVCAFEEDDCGKHEDTRQSLSDPVVKNVSVESVNSDSECDDSSSKPLSKDQHTQIDLEDGSDINQKDGLPHVPSSTFLTTSM